ncbi:transcriptional regulator family: Fungal Specific TF [Paecilomyces variotii]|nr:transcriptional regulator family: Fungal Specific TF [Paecilomyces variotii]KAJ9239873.1 transcriptional regulator family: Fungal Specific TF [Paecilomyces variotii]KAJ9244659.1 transcriptional regulator family: Fungal Specific TF [Paecilomyces variotii]KAJ9257104.1 transcriptional regulator family: Fungal Specific TF [Paecilomyces variotii]
MGTNNPNTQYKCTRCGRHYSNASHLRRHEATHSSTPRATCGFCKQQFLRSDVLRRHSRTCKHKDTRVVLSQPTRGRKRKACDSCAQSRMVCDGELPCETCLARKLDCSYNRMQQANTSCTSSQEESDSRPQRITISFLLNYTDPVPRSSYDLLQFLTRKNDDAPVPESSVQNYHQGNNTGFWQSIFHDFIDTSALGPPSQETGLTYGCHESENIPVTIDRLLTELKQYQTHLPGIKPDLIKAEAFFSSSNLLKFVTSFFQHCYTSDRFVHEASFNVNTVSTALLLAVVLLGATCASPADAALAEQYLTVAEYLVFENTGFHQLLYHDENPPQSRKNIELVQAAIIVMYLQSASDQVEFKRRIRIQRFPSLVSVIRSLRLTQAINDTPLSSREFVLQDYVHKETLVRIISWVYLADTHLVVFYRCPPQFKIFEADFGLPQHDELFEAVDPLDSERIVSQIRDRPKPMSLKSILRLLMDDSPVQMEEILLQTNSLFSLFLIMSALQSILFEIFSMRSCFPSLELFRPIDRALDRWKMLWDLFHTRHECTGASGSAYVVHASTEHWWLAKALIKRRDMLVDEEAGCAADSMNTFHNLVKRLTAEDVD